MTSSEKDEPPTSLHVSVLLLDSSLTALNDLSQENMISLSSMNDHKQNSHNGLFENRLLRFVKLFGSAPLDFIVSPSLTLNWILSAKKKKLQRVPCLLLFLPEYIYCPCYLTYTTLLKKVKTLLYQYQLDCWIMIRDAYAYLYLCEWLMCINCMNIVLIFNVSGFVEMLAIESTTNFPFGDNKVNFIYR